jgi:hypothetical protein
MDARNAPVPKRFGAVFVAAAFLCMFACRSEAPSQTRDLIAKASPKPSPAPSPQAAGNSEASAEAKGLLKLALDALDANHLAEAIKNYVAVLAIADSDASAEAEAVKARAELTKIASRLSVEPQETWLGPDGSQIGSTTRGIGKPGALQPSVYLYENYGAGKAPVPDAPLVFEFSANSGALTAFVTTDSFGMANTNVTKVQDAAKPAIIRVYPLFKSRGFSYAFSGVSREFAYLPPVNSVIVASLSESKAGMLANSLTTDLIAPGLKEAGLEVLPFAGSAARNDFLAALGGGAEAVARLNGSTRAGYLLLVYVEVHNVVQQEYKGKKYNLFQAQARGSARLLRSDGTILHSIALESLRGDGGDEVRAVDACYRAADQALVDALKKDAPAIRQALSKD